ncbi:L-type lectin-domain containing receptor kinase VIII.2-like isoform X2 [Rhododendron vialii]|uniref:L-type lectin-domain containing receptor kinase VIII.2-like isoform X2 n=1 Tax=Rhododendron vialii TaxID=182163 RepID=UPI00265F66A2|nr:L-type lectin-domain containing receptor kinase VIII.2-like isoform X2 [Rhododendron vialii]
MELTSDLVKYTYEDLNSITEGFSAENFIGNTQYGKVFRGNIQQGLETQVVTVKIWVEFGCWSTVPSRQKEIKLLTDPDVKVHPNTVKLIGCCGENGQLGVVYDLQPINSLSNIVLQDDFKWIHRIKVALGFARLLDFLHDKGLWVHNITPDHLLVDQAFNPKLFDFSMLVGGVFGEISDHKREGGSAGYIDLHGAEIGDRSDKTDVFAYGAVLLGLITKTVYDGEEHFRLGLEHLICFWAWVEYNKKPKSKFLLFRSKKDIKEIARTYWGVYKERKSKSLVHESLRSDPSFDAGDGVEITKLAIRCVQRSLEQRPTMKQVVSCLKNLKCFGDSHAMRI